MSKEILDIVISLSNEKGLAEDVVFSSVEAALAAVASKRYEEDVDVRVAIDRDTGDYDTFRRWTVTDAGSDELIDYPAMYIALDEAQKIDSDLVNGDVVEEAIESPKFGRIAAQQAKQVLIQKVREAERAKVAQEYSLRIGELILGIVKRVTRDHLILDMGSNVEGFLSRDEMVPREAFRVGDRLRVLLYGINDEKRGPQLLFTRTRSEFLIGLFSIEVPEIGEEVISIPAAARDPGSRAKIAVKTNDGRIDPVGACVGMRGARVQAVSNELNGERIDIILWDDNPAQFVINAMAPAEISSIVMDEDTHSMDIAVTEEQLSQAIGRGGQNVRLASELSGWTLNVMSEDDAVRKQQVESTMTRDIFVDKLDLDAELAELLVQEGFSGVSDIAFASKADMLKIAEFDEEIVEELQSRAKDALLEDELSGKTPVAPGKDLLAVEGMTGVLAKQLAKNGIVSRDDLAEQSIDELVEVVKMDDESAGKLIMAARAHWFLDDK